MALNTIPSSSLDLDGLASSSGPADPPAVFSRFLVSIPNLLSLAIYLLVIVSLWSISSKNLNPDALSYIKLASYWRDGNLDLAISGYWGPLVSWLIVPLLALSDDLAVVGRLAAALAGITLPIAAESLFRTVALPGRIRLIMGVPMALAAADWASRGMAPDLLMTALLIVGLSALLRALLNGGWLAPLLAAGCFALAYYVKTPGLPLGLALTVGLSVIGWIAMSVPWRRAVAAGTFITGLLCLLAAPWIVVLSGKYGEPTFTTAAKRNVEIGAGLYHPNFSEYHLPRAGRISSWEDPTEFNGTDAYETKPVSIVRLLKSNLFDLRRHLGYFDLIGLLPGLTIAAFFIGFLRRDSRPAWVLLPVAAAIWTTPFILTSAVSIRYFYGVFPMMLAATGGMIVMLGRLRVFDHMTVSWPKAAPALQGAVWLAFAGLTTAPSVIDLAGLVSASRVGISKYELGKSIGQDLRDGGGFQGIAALAKPNSAIAIHHIALYAAASGGVPLMGRQESLDTLDRLQELGASHLLVETGHAGLPLIEASPGVVDVSDRLLPDGCGMLCAELKVLALPDP